MAPRYYRAARHGPRFRYRRGPYRYFYSGWWYARPWWLIASPLYAPSDYVVSDYAVEPYVEEPVAYEHDVYASVGSGGQCEYWSDRCIENWGYQNPNYVGCLRYHGCD